jgi:radical SAM protein with 4Fe4S-binding SPASM domain
MEGLNIKYHSNCQAGNEITVTPGGKVTICPAWPHEIGDIKSSKKELEEKLKGIREKAKNCEGCLMMENNPKENLISSEV